MTAADTAIKTLSARQMAFKILLSFERQRFQNKIGDQRLKADEQLHALLPTIAEAERPLGAMLVYGVLRHWWQLDAWIAHQTARKPADAKSAKHLKQFDPQVRCLLRLGMFQVVFLSQIPDYAAIDTTMELAKRLKLNPKARGFLNGVLRRFAENSALQTESDASIFSANWQAYFAAHYSPQELQQMADAIAVQSPMLCVRVNLLKTTVAAYCEVLQQAGVVFEPVSDELPELLFLPGFKGSPTHLPGFQAGWVYVQDASSAQVAYWLAPQPGERVLDLCAAPGSKTTHMAALTNNQAEIVSVEPIVSRANRMRDNLTRLGATSVTILETTAEAALLPPNTFDRVLVDAPCSGTGTLKRHPDILVQWRSLDQANYPGLQHALLTIGLGCLKPGGQLVYSTCSIDPAENRSVVDAVLAERPEATLLKDEQRLITSKQDGFYLALITKKNDPGFPPSRE